MFLLLEVACVSLCDAASLGMLCLLMHQVGTKLTTEYSRHAVLPKILLRVCFYYMWSFFEGLRDADKSIIFPNFATALKLHVHILWQISLPSLR